MDRLLFGDNQFFGVNHMSEDKARAQAMQFRDTDAIVSVLDDAYDAGLKTFMCTTHDAVAEIAGRVRGNPDRYPGFQFFPGMPYAHKYANALAEVGPVDALKRFAPGGVIDTAVRGVKSAVRRDADELMRLLVDAELQPFAGLDTPVVFLQNVVTDLLLGLGMHSMLRSFSDHLRERHGVEAGFITMNLPRLLDALDTAGVDDPIVCCNYNKIGFRMSGGIEAYDDALENRRFRCIAMSVFASGAIEPDEAISWICERPRIGSIVFGASSSRNIRSTIALVERHSGRLDR
ncbi:MAG: hypothetical protein RI958_1796 [Actinomycetota bacterium]|jgi:hypothetical protein